MKRKRIAVIGAGAIGASVAAEISRSGLNVTVIDQWPEHVQAIRNKGLTVKMGEEVTRVHMPALHLCQLAETRDKFDIAMIGVKAYDTRWTAELIKSYLQPDALVVGLQNSLCDDEIAAAIGRNRTVGCVVELAAEIFDPGVLVRHTPPSKTWFGIGALDASQRDRLKEIAGLLGCGARVSILDNVTAAKWTKLIANAVILGPVGALGTPIARAFELPGMRSIAAEIGKEALAVAQACGYEVQPVFGLGLDELAGEPETVARKLVDTIIEHIGPSARSSVTQDHLKNRYSEVDMLNGLVARFGDLHGIATPYNKMIVELNHRIWHGQITPKEENLKMGNLLLNSHVAAGN